MNKHEEEFAELLKQRNIKFVPQYNILVHGIIAARVDFYLPEYTLYCEIVSSRQGLCNRIKVLQKLLNKKYRLTFYCHTGEKVLLTHWMEGILGIENENLPFIPGLENKVISIAGRVPHGKWYQTVRDLE